MWDSVSSHKLRQQIYHGKYDMADVRVHATELVKYASVLNALGDHRIRELLSWSPNLLLDFHHSYVKRYLPFCLKRMPILGQSIATRFITKEVIQEALKIGGVAAIVFVPLSSVPSNLRLKICFNRIGVNVNEATSLSSDELVARITKGDRLFNTVVNLCNTYIDKYDESSLLADITAFLAAGKVERLVGIELEFISTECEITHALHSLIADKVGRAWKIEVDNTTSNMYELQSPPLPAKEVVNEIVKMLCVIKAFEKARVIYLTDACGIHFHLSGNDVQPGTLKDIYTAYYNVFDITGRLLSKQRKNNKYCKPMTLCRHDWDGLLVLDVKRCYDGVNPAAYTKYRTVEFRHLQSTTSIKTVLAFLLIVHSITKFRGRFLSKAYFNARDVFNSMGITHLLRSLGVYSQ